MKTQTKKVPLTKKQLYIAVIHLTMIANMEAEIGSTKEDREVEADLRALIKYLRSFADEIDMQAIDSVETMVKTKFGFKGGDTK